ncbi:MAG: YqgE/AlgH family protein, partial [Burkholderiales bacterium]
MVCKFARSKSAMMGCLSRSIAFRESIRAVAALAMIALAMPFSFAQGFLLVAKPLMIDPNFERTVVLAVRTEDGGTTGFVLNRPFNRSLA